jgi:hypothetical protein
VLTAVKEKQGRRRTVYFEVPVKAAVGRHGRGQTSTIMVHLVGEKGEGMSFLRWVWSLLLLVQGNFQRLQQAQKWGQASQTHLAVS